MGFKLKVRNLLILKDFLILMRLPWYSLILR